MGSSELAGSVGLYVDDLWVTIAPEQLIDGGSESEIDYFIGQLVGPHSVDGSAIENATLRGPDELRDPFNWSYDPTVGDKL